MNEYIEWIFIQWVTRIKICSSCSSRAYSHSRQYSQLEALDRKKRKRELHPKKAIIERCGVTRALPAWSQLIMHHYSTEKKKETEDIERIVGNEDRSRGKNG